MEVCDQRWNCAYVLHGYRRALRRERRFRDRLDPLALSDNELMSKYCFPRHELILMIEELEPRKTQVSTHTQLLMALRFFASDSFQNVIGDTAGKISKFISVACFPIELAVLKVLFMA